MIRVLWFLLVGWWINMDDEPPKLALHWPEGRGDRGIVLESVPYFITYQQGDWLVWLADEDDWADEKDRLLGQFDFFSQAASFIAEQHRRDAEGR